MEIGDSPDLGAPCGMPYGIASSLWVLFLCRCYRYAKERLYAGVNDFEQITSISIE